MSDETAVAEYSADTKSMGDKIAEMTLKQAKELSDYLKDEHGIEPASGGGVMMAAPGGGDGGGDGGGGNGGGGDGGGGMGGGGPTFLFGRSRSRIA